MISVIATAFVSCKTTTSSSATSADRFTEADTNHDGKLSRDEANDYFVGQIFDSRNLNHDGQLTWDEWNVPSADRSKAKFNAADTNKDGSLSREEALAYGRTRGAFNKEFEEADTNHDVT